MLGGAVEYAGHLLGDPFTLAGEVVHGDKRGRELGYPTANIVPDAAFVTPGHGVYAAHRADRRRGRRGRAVRPAAVSIGVRPTFVTGPRRAHRGLPAGLRRRPLRRARSSSAFRKRLRGEKRFESVDALIDQMALDVRGRPGHLRVTSLQ